MRTIAISTDVFAAIWAHREPGEDSEDAILRRLLKVRVSPSTASTETGTKTGVGFVDERNGVRFEEGFKIFRTYKGRKFAATATGGRWSLNNGQTYPSLHKLSSAVVSGRENSWQNWKYQKPDGSEAFIDSLRDSSVIATRTA